MEEHSGFLKYIYHEDLYLIDEPSPSAECVVEESHKELDNQHTEEENMVQESATVTYLGNNEQGILILVEDSSDDLLNQKDLDLLMKIVESGLKRSKNDFALVNTAKFTVEQILNEVRYSYLISFGIDLSDLFSDTTPYVIHKEDKSMLLISESLSSMHNDDQRKGKLWLALKSMFNIS